MATFVKLNGFCEHLAEKVHNLGSDQLVIAITNTAPGSESTPPTGATGSNILANLTQITYNLSSRNVTTASSGQASGTYTLALTDLVLTASSACGPMRYFYLYNDTPSSPADPLIGYWDYGSSISLSTGETMTIDFAAGTITIA